MTPDEKYLELKKKLEQLLMLRMLDKETDYTEELQKVRYALKKVMIEKKEVNNNDSNKRR